MLIRASSKARSRSSLEARKRYEIRKARLGDWSRFFVGFGSGGGWGGDWWFLDWGFYPMGCGGVVGYDGGL